MGGPVTDRSLAVHLYGQRIGTLVQTAGGGHFFTYAETYAEAGGTPLSLAMPIAPSSYAKKRIDPFLEGLLPDNSDVRERWGQRFGVNGRITSRRDDHANRVTPLSGTQLTSLRRSPTNLRVLPTSWTFQRWASVGRRSSVW
ncbi:HipA N-terminal domain-containing protein [Promicromonospora sp. NPDC023987]|uniref:HipA N-terminal domain-containing protein n=1 Tax=Promicromonospora sp. NPDC023987 TaxID=3155360 RepID=UPI0033D530E5